MLAGALKRCGLLAGCDTGDLEFRGLGFGICGDGGIPSQRLLSLVAFYFHTSVGLGYSCSWLVLRILVDLAFSGRWDSFLDSGKCVVTSGSHFGIYLGRHPGTFGWFGHLLDCFLQHVPPDCVVF